MILNSSLLSTEVPLAKIQNSLHSSTYYFGTAANEWDWTAPQNGNLWRDGAKTLFDPCPAGWRVPRSGAGVLSPWNDFGTDPYAAPFFYYINGVRQTAPGVPAFALSPNNGRRYDRGNGGVTVWYLATGYRNAGRDSFEGVLTGVGYQGFSWSSTASGANGYFLGFDPVSLGPSYAGYRGYGFSVRCVRE